MLWFSSFCPTLGCTTPIVIDKACRSWSRIFSFPFLIKETVMKCRPGPDPGIIDAPSTKSGGSSSTLLFACGGIGRITGAKLEVRKLGRTALGISTHITPSAGAFVTGIWSWGVNRRVWFTKVPEFPRTLSTLCPLAARVEDPHRKPHVQGFLPHHPPPL